MLLKCLPLGFKPGNFIISKYKENNVLSFVFRVKMDSGRDDLLSFSILIDKKLEATYYQPILQEIIDALDDNGLLNEYILKTYQEQIYEAINQEKDLMIESIMIPLSKQFKIINSQIKKDKPNLKGSFF